jgi:peptidoglycan-associated lipoprotein
MKSNLTKVLLAIVSVAFVAGCASKKKTEETQAPPVVDNSPMAFDAAGSDSGKIDGLQTVRFGYDQSSLSAEAKKQLADNATWMKSHDKINVQIEGHCDSRGSLEYNLALGERRAQSVKNYLVGLGISTAQMTVISYGKEKPLATGDNEEAWSKNRRANFVPLAK